MKKVIFISLIAAAAFWACSKKEDKLPTVAVANYGPLKDLAASIEGIKSELRDGGFEDGKTVKIEVADIAFDHALIPQVIAKL